MSFNFSDECTVIMFSVYSVRHYVYVCYFYVYAAEQELQGKLALMRMATVMPTTLCLTSIQIPDFLRSVQRSLFTNNDRRPHANRALFTRSASKLLLYCLARVA